MGRDSGQPRALPAAASVLARPGRPATHGATTGEGAVLVRERQVVAGGGRRTAVRRCVRAGERRVVLLLRFSAVGGCERAVDLTERRRMEHQRGVAVPCRRPVAVAVRDDVVARVVTGEVDGLPASGGGTSPSDKEPEDSDGTDTNAYEPFHHASSGVASGP